VVLQQLHNVVVQPLLSNVPGKPVHVVGDVPVSAMVQESLSCLVTSFSTREEQGCFIFAVLSVSIGSMGE